MSQSLSEWFPVRQFCQRHQDRFTVHQIRWLLRYADDNGLVSSGAAVKVSGRWLLSEPGFAAWIAAHRGGAAA